MPFKQTNCLYNGSGYVYRAELGVNPYDHRYNEDIWKPIEEDLSHVVIDITHTVTRRTHGRQILQNGLKIDGGYGKLTVTLNNIHYFMLSYQNESVLIETETMETIWMPKARFLGSPKGDQFKCEWIFYSNDTDPLYVRKEKRTTKASST